MPTQEELVFTVLDADATLQSLVAEKVFGGPMPQNTPLPAVAYYVIAKDPRLTLSGPSDLLRSTFEVHAYAGAYLDAKTIAAAVKAALTAHTATFRAVWLGAQDQYIATPEAYVVTQQFSIWSS